MDIWQQAERMMGMDDAVWRRHANPASALTRFTVLPLLVLAVWSRVWIGWGAVIAVALVLVWNWWNPRAFAPPRSYDHWMSRGVLGERVFLAHRRELPAHHQRAAKLLTWASVPGLVLMIWGLWALSWEAAVFGLVLCVLPKVWFVDRMVWILQDWRMACGVVPGFEDIAREGEHDV